jgi:hypothetical protein
VTASIFEEGSGDNYPNCAVTSVPITDGGYNVESDNTCGFGSASTVNSSTIGLGLPALNANEQLPNTPQTDAISQQSSAFEVVPASFCHAVATTDERGLPRPGFPGQNCDAGASELQETTLTAKTMAVALGKNTFSGTLEVANHVPLVGVPVLFSFKGTLLCGAYTNANGVATCTSKVDAVELQFDRLTTKDTYLASYAGTGGILAATANGKL